MKTATMRSLPTSWPFPKHGGINWRYKNMQVDQIARICHEANRTHCMNIGDHSQPVWENAPDWQKDSAIKGVQFHLANPEATPAASHEAWLREKEADGWKFGREKNPELKEHPCYVPFDQLPVEQQAKDHLFRGIVHSLAPFAQQI